MLSSLNKYSDWGLLVLRVSVAAAFLYHGWQKLDAQILNRAAETAMDPLMATLGVIEPLAGIMLILGLWTRIASIAISIIMIGAIYMKATGFGQAAFDLLGTYGSGGQWKFDLVLLGGAVALLTIGAGKLSLDYKIWKQS